MDIVKRVFGRRPIQEVAISPPDQGFIFTDENHLSVSPPRTSFNSTITDSQSTEQSTITDSQSTTENGAKSVGDTGNARVNLFFKLVRNTPETYLADLLKASWEESPLDTMKIIFLTRNCRGGKGEKNQFKNCCKWLMDNGFTASLQKNLQHFPTFGSWRDYLNLLDTQLEGDMVKFFTQQLKNDLMAESPSLAAKWAPSEGCHFDNKFHAVSKFCRELGITKADYRKNILVPLRRKLRIVETPVCQEEFDSIKYDHVPSLAMARYKTIFAAKDTDRFKKYIQDVKSGTAKMNVGQLLPHEIVGKFLHVWGERFEGLSQDDIATLEVQWSQYLENFKKLGLQKSLSIVDTSGSMQGTPLQVAVAMGMLFAQSMDKSDPFFGKIITFSANPRWHDIPDVPLSQQVASIEGISDWGMNTNLQATFDLILATAKSFRVPAENMPQTLFIFSDMQFDDARRNDKTNFEVMQAKYQEAGYELPRIVFWNLRGDTIDFPTTASTPNTALVSGYSPSLMKLFIQTGNLNPYEYLRIAIDDKAYDCIQV